MAAIAARARWPGLRRSSGRRTASASRPKCASSVRARDSSTPAAAWRRNHGSSGPVAARSCGRCGSRRTLVVTSTWPALGGSVPSRRLSSVVFPAPLAPEIGDPVAAVEREVDVLEHAGADAAQRRHAARRGRRRRRGAAAAAAASRGSSTQSRRRARAPGGARAPSPSSRPSWRSASACRRPGRSRCARCGGRGRGCRRCRPEPPAPLVLRLDELLEPGAAARALGAVGGVAALVGLERAAGGELVDAVDDGVEEAPVVRDDEQGAVEAGEEVLEPREAVGVEVVGRLVEQQHLRVLEQRRREQRARLLAAREAVQRPVARQVLDPEPAPDLLGAGLGGPGLRRLGALERVGVAVEVAFVRRCRAASASPASPSASWSSESSVASPAGASCGR